MAWKKIVVSGSAAELASINVDGQVSASSFTGDGSGLTNIVAPGTISSSAQIASDISGAFDSTSASLASSITNLTTTDQIFSGSFSGSYVGDGSQLTNITVDQNATVVSEFTLQTTQSVVHNFQSENVSVVVYDENNEQFIPSKVKLVSANQVDIFMDPATTGKAIVVRGGHVVSGSIPFANLIAVPTLLSSSAQIADDISGSFAAASASFAADITALETFSSSLDNTFASEAELNASSSTLQGNIDTLETNTTAALNASSSTLQGNIDTLETNARAELNASSSTINTRIDNLSSTLAISGSSGNDSVNLVTDALTFAGTDNEIETTVTNNQVQIGIVSNPILTGDVTITGNLNVTGDTIQAQVSNINVEDRFILLNSGSTTGDSGIVFGGSDGSANQGSGIFWDSPANIFGFSQGISAEDTTATHTSKLGNIQTAASTPSTAPTFQGVGTVHVNTSDEGIWIYS